MSDAFTFRVWPALAGTDASASVRGGADVVRALYAALPPVGTPEDTLRLVDDLERRLARDDDEQEQAA
jgi:hypothetical protein